MTRVAPLYGVFASKSQVNLVIPEGTALGQASLRVTGQGGLSLSESVNIVPSAPGIFQGAEVVHSQPVGSGSDQVVLVLYGTGIRHHADNSVTATVNGQSVPVLYSGAQPTYPGVDQVNLKVPQGLTGTVEVVITVDGFTANTVSVQLR
jgi:uncharacterized protein (TIGR03437 family)